MLKRLIVFAAAVLFAGSVSLAAGTPKSTTKAKKAATSWSGWITDSECGAKGANAKHTECAKKCVDTKGAKYVLYSTASKKTYSLDDQTAAAAHAGPQVQVHGTVDGDTIHVTSITMPAAKKPAAAKPSS